MKADEFGDRMKNYESQATAQRLDVHKPIVARIDGKTFSTFTRNCQKPFDIDLSKAFWFTTSELVKQTHAKIGYTQSDEITLVYRADRPESSIWFDGRVQKMTSVLASMATAFFNASYQADKPAFFDCRVWQVPDETEAANTVLWRCLDARKNAISSACRALYSPKEMKGWGQAKMKEKIQEKLGSSFEDTYISSHRHGVFFGPVKTTLTRLDSTDQFERTKVMQLDMPFFLDIRNREDVIFSHAEPISC